MVQQNVEPAQQDTSPENTQVLAEREELYFYYRLEEPVSEVLLEKWQNSGVPIRNVDCGKIDTNLETLNIGGNEVPTIILDKLRRIMDSELENLKEIPQDSDEWKYAYSHHIGKALYENLHMIRGEVESIEVWQFIGLCVLPTAAFARFAPSNKDRHIGNLRRHVLRRTWLTYDLLGEVMDEGGYLTEDDLNQILDRTSISTNRDLALALARTLNSVGAPSDYGLGRGASARKIKRKIAEELTVRMGVEMVQYKSYEDMCALLEAIKKEVIEDFKLQEGITEEQDEDTWDSDSDAAEDYESEDVEIEEIEDSEDLDAETDEYDESHYEDFSDEEFEEEEESADLEVAEDMESPEPEAEESDAEESEAQEPEERPLRLRTPQSKLKAKLEQVSPEVTADEEAHDQASEAKTHKSKLTPPKSKMGQFWDNMPWKR